MNSSHCKLMTDATQIPANSAAVLEIDLYLWTLDEGHAPGMVLWRS